MLLKSITWSWGLVILWLSLYPFEVDTHGVKLMPHADKLVHGVMHGIMAFLLAWNFQPAVFLSKKVFLLSLVAILYGTIIELCQEVMALGRSFDFLDIVANTIGVFVGLTGYFILKNVLFSSVDKN